MEQDKLIASTSAPVHQQEISTEESQTSTSDVDMSPPRAPVFEGVAKEATPEPQKPFIEPAAPTTPSTAQVEPEVALATVERLNIQLRKRRRQIEPESVRKALRRKGYDEAICSPTMRKIKDRKFMSKLALSPRFFPSIYDSPDKGSKLTFDVPPKPVQSLQPAVQVAPIVREEEVAEGYFKRFLNILWPF
jgi:hypothetical protein